MKKTNQIRISLALIATVCALPFNNYAQERAPIKGVYKTADDYNKGNLCTDYSEFVYKTPGNKLFFAEKGAEVKEKWHTRYVEKDAKGVSLEECTFYGYVDNDGFTWRIVQETRPHEKACFRIIQKGKICLYTTGNITFEQDASGNITKMDCQNAESDYHYDDEGKQSARPSTTQFYFNFYVSNGSDGQMLCCQESNLNKLMADDADILAKIKDKGIYQLRHGKWGESLADVMGWVKDYNSKHK